MASPLYRMIPDGRLGGAKVSIAGTPAAVAANSVIDVPLEHARTLNGWTSCGKVGATAARPAGASSGETFVDTTLGYMIVADGTGLWHNPVTGAIV